MLPKLSICLTVAGKLFHTRSPATAKLLSLRVVQRVFCKRETKSPGRTDVPSANRTTPWASYEPQEWRFVQHRNGLHAGQCGRLCCRWYQQLRLSPSVSKHTRAHINQLWPFSRWLRLIDCGFMSHSTQNASFRRRFPSQSLGLVWEKLNLTQQKHAFTNQKKCTTTQNKYKKPNLGLIAFYDMRPGNGADLFSKEKINKGGGN